MIVLLARAVVVLLSAGAMPVHQVYPLRRNCQMLWLHANNAVVGVWGITRMKHLEIRTRFESISRQRRILTNTSGGGVSAKLHERRMTLLRCLCEYNVSAN